MAGIEDVAKLAGVSTATVSRALSGKDHVSAKARAAVEAAAAELGYVVSHSAYTLATGRNRNIGVVMPQVDRWFFSTILEAAETALISNGYDLTLYNLRGGEDHRSQVFQEFLMRGRVDAVLAVAIQPSEAEIAALDRLGKPIVGIGGIIRTLRTAPVMLGIGNDMALDPGIGTCGKDGQGVPCGVGQPTLKIERLTVGGTAV